MQDMSQQSEENAAARRATVLAIGGHDAGGGAGISADIETISTLGVHPLTLITALTVQDTCSMSALEPVDPSIMLRQFDAIHADITINVVKIGMLGSLDALAAVMTMLDELEGVPVIFDPVLAAGGGGEASSMALREAIVSALLPRCFLLTPNTIEARRLGGSDDLQQAADNLLAAGVDNLLLTGSHETGDEIVHRWHSNDGESESWQWQRLPGEYHGSGCTLASAVAAFIARGMPLKMALGLAQAFAYDALQRAYRIGSGQLIPGRAGEGKG